MRLKPSEIRFMQDSIYYQFYGRKNINEYIEDIISGTRSIYSISDITVVKKDDKYYSHDNRRLYLFRVLELRNRIETINVNVSTSFPSEKFTTKDDGRSIYMRGGTAYPHEIPPSPPPSPASVGSDVSSESSDIATNQLSEIDVEAQELINDILNQVEQSVRANKLELNILTPSASNDDIPSNASPVNNRKRHLSLKDETSEDIPDAETTTTSPVIPLDCPPKQARTCE